MVYFTLKGLGHISSSPDAELWESRSIIAKLPSCVKVTGWHDTVGDTQI